MDNCCISVEQVYEKPNPKIPEGYRKLDFRPYKKGDTVLTTSESAYVVGGSSYGRPFIILEKLPPKPEVIDRGKCYTYEVKTYEAKSVGDIYKQDVTIPTGFKFKAFRPPIQGDWFISTWLEAIQARYKPINGEDQPRIILEKV